MIDYHFASTKAKVGMKLTSPSPAHLDCSCLFFSLCRDLSLPNFAPGYNLNTEEESEQRIFGCLLLNTILKRRPKRLDAGFETLIDMFPVIQI